MSDELGGWDAYVEAVVRIESPAGVRWLKPDSIFRTDQPQCIRSALIYCPGLEWNPHIARV